MNSELISVIIPVYNSERTLERCVESVLFNTYQNFELVLIDDGSTDHSRAICDMFALRDNRVKVFHTDNQGANKARNHGVSKSIGVWVTFVDSDDWLPPYALEELLSHSKSTDIVVGLKWSSNTKDRIVSIKEWRNYLIEGGYYCSPIAKLFRRTLFSPRVFFINKDIVVCEDDIMNVRLAFASNCDVPILSRQCYFYEKNPNSITSNWRWTFDKFYRVYQEVKDSIPTNQLPDYYGALARRLMIVIKEVYYTTPASVKKADTIFPIFEELLMMSKLSGTKLPLLFRLSARCPYSVFVKLFWRIDYFILILKQYIRRKIRP